MKKNLKTIIIGILILALCAGNMFAEKAKKIKYPAYEKTIPMKSALNWYDNFVISGYYLDGDDVEKIENKIFIINETDKDINVFIKTKAQASYEYVSKEISLAEKLVPASEATIYEDYSKISISDRFIISIADNMKISKAQVGAKRHNLYLYIQEISPKEEVIYEEITEEQIKNSNLEDIIKQKADSGVKGVVLKNVYKHDISYVFKKEPVHEKGIVLKKLPFDDTDQAFDEYFKRADLIGKKVLEDTQPYTIYLNLLYKYNEYGKEKIKVLIEKIDGLRSKEEAKADREEKDAKANAEKQKAIDEKMKSLAKGYVLHGIDEANSNVKLFEANALENGHAYYISGFTISSGGSLAKIINSSSLFREPTPLICNINFQYLNQKTRGEVVTASETAFGSLPVSVIVAGGNVPVILGLAE